MFGRKRSKQEQTVDTIIGVGTVIEGKITHPKSLRIDGKVIGEIDCTGDVFIGKNGMSEPVIRARNLIVAGEVNAEVYTTEQVHILKGGKLSGTITSSGIVIDEGGIFNGTSTIVSEDSNVMELKLEERAENT